MFREDSTIGNVKHEVLKAVAKLAFEGNLNDNLDKIPYELIPGPQANFRCCIYKEREIIRQRVRLAQGKAPSADRDNKNIVQVIPAACEGCPIARYVVTDNCQKCMGKGCLHSCHFDAITMGRDRAYIDPQKCKECGKCSQACPYNAIADLMRPCKRSCPVDAITMDEYDIVQIDEEKCIHCGACIKDCPFGAISDRSFMVDVINIINTGDFDVYAMFAPSGEGQFGADAHMGAMREAIKQLGFTDMYEVALGGDMVAESEAKEWAEAYKEGKKMTTSCCPAFVHMIKKHFPQLEENMSTTVSPMAAVSRMIKAMNPNALTVFIGPCIAKKSEVIDSLGTGNADYALTFEELNCMLEAKKINPADYQEEELQQGSIYGKRFGNAGGVTKAVVQALDELGENSDAKVRQCNGAAECKKALTLLKVGRLPEDFMEGMACAGGCVNGPGSVRPELMAKKDRESLLSKADERKIVPTVTPYYEEYGFSMHRK
jgi:ferredoxin hydrogenase large subunit